MRKLSRWAALIGGALIVVLAGCSTPVFDPTGTYTGDMQLSGTPSYSEATVTSTSTTGSWGFQLATSGGAFTGTCTHNTTVSADNLTCTFTAYSTTSQLSGDVKGNTWDGNISGGITGTFTLTR